LILWIDLVAEVGRRSGVARKLRIQYDGALYHVLNRGNYRRDVFGTAGAAQAFVTALEEVTVRYQWRIHAYVVMRNHYHLALETPQANLVDGMHWLQGTISTRFNRLRDERGHLFQGRYQSLLVEDFQAMARLVDYIHLNPVRAGIVTGDQVAAFRWSSLRRFVKGGRFAGLVAGDCLEAIGLKDTVDGWRAYLDRLAAMAVDPAVHEGASERFSSGWAIGTEGWRSAIAKEHAHLALSPAIEATQLRDLKRARWRECLSGMLADMGRTSDDLRGAAKSAPWKVALALRLRAKTGAAVEWIAQELHMGRSSAVRSYLSRSAARSSMQQTSP
jgi:REP element-mobilizing transposase RayT